MRVCQELAHPHTKNQMNKPYPYEQELAYAYSTRKILHRPSITYWQFSLKWGITGLALAASIFVLYLYHLYCPVHLLYPLIGCIIVSTMLLIRYCLIDCIQLYQHYAPEDIRRRCRMMPSCSEYAILSLKKFGIILGLILICHRVFHTCGGEYKIEYPSLKNLYHGTF